MHAQGTKAKMKKTLRNGTERNRTEQDRVISDYSLDRFFGADAKQKRTDVGLVLPTSRIRLQLHIHMAAGSQDSHNIIALH